MQRVSAELERLVEEESAAAPEAPDSAEFPEETFEP